jgi:ribosome maturation factor RimP
LFLEGTNPGRSTAHNRFMHRERDGARSPKATDVVARVRPLAERVAHAYGLDIFDLQFRREANGWVLRVFIDRPEGTERETARAGEPGDSIGIDECERVNRELGTLLDLEDIGSQSYTLEVSSPGLDRPLRGASDYQRFSGRLAKIVLTRPVDGQTFFRGRLGGMSGEDVLLTDEGGRARHLPLSAIARAQLDVEF